MRQSVRSLAHTLTFAVLASAAALSTFTQPAIAQRGAEVAADRLHTATVRYTPGSAADNGYTWASVDVTYTFFTCTSGSTSVFAAYDVREGSIKTSSTYVYKGRTVNATGPAPDDEFIRIQGAVLSGGQHLAPFSVTASHHSDIDTNCREGHNNTTRVADLARHVGDVANVRAVQAWVNLLAIRFGPIVATLRNQDLEAALAQRLRADEKALADRATQARQDSIARAQQARAQERQAQQPAQPSAADRAQAAEEARAVERERSAAATLAAIAAVTERQDAERASLEAQVETVKEVAGLVGSMMADRRADQQRKAENEQRVAAKRQVEARERREAAQVRLASMKSCDAVAPSQLFGEVGSYDLSSGCRMDGSNVAMDYDLILPAADRFLISLTATSATSVRGLRIKAFEGPVVYEAAATVQWDRRIIDLQPGRYTIRVWGDLSGDTRFSHWITPGARYAFSPTGGLAIARRPLVPCVEALGSMEIMVPGETREMSARFSQCDYVTMKGFPVMAGINAVTRFYLDVAEAQTVEIEVTPAATKGHTIYRLGLFEPGSDTATAGESGEGKRGRAKLKRRVAAGRYEVEFLVVTGEGMDEGAQSTVVVKGKRGATARTVVSVPSIPGIGATVQTVRFSGMVAGDPPPGKREYATRFPDGLAQIVPELTLRMSPARAGASAPLVCSIVDQQGRTRSTAMGTWQPRSTDTLGIWSPGPMLVSAGKDSTASVSGVYRLYCGVDQGRLRESIIIARDSFEIVTTYIGTGIQQRADSSGVLVTGVLAMSPAARGGVLAGDRIVTIEGIPTIGVPQAEINKRILGAAGTTVRFTLRRHGVAAPLEVQLTRGSVMNPPGGAPLSRSSTGPAADAVVIESMNLSISAPRAYEGPGTYVLWKDRVYAAQFASASTRFIALEATIDKPVTAGSMTLITSCQPFREDGTPYGTPASEQFTMTADAWQGVPVVLDYRGWKEPGNWVRGKYTMRCVAGGKVLAVTPFEIF